MGRQCAYVINSEGGKPRRLPIESLSNLSAWSRDGRWLYFGSSAGGENQIWKTGWPVSEHRADAIQVTRNGGGGAIESPDGKFLFYMKGPGEGRNSVWRIPVGGGEETQVLGSVLNNNFAVVEQGIYFIPGSQPFSVRFLNSASGNVTTIASIPREPAWGLSVSPDGRWLLYAEFEGVRADLMLVESFR